MGLLTFLQNNRDIITKYIEIILPSLCTFLVGYYKQPTKQKQEIYKKQLKNVYLPLYLLTKEYLDDDFTCLDNLNKFLSAANKITSENILLVHKRIIYYLDKLPHILDSGLMNDEINKDYIVPLKKDILRHFFRIRKALYYPVSPTEYFMGTTFFDVFLIILYVILLLCFLLFGIYFLALIVNHDFEISSLFVVISFCFFCAVYILHGIRNS